MAYPKLNEDPLRLLVLKHVNMAEIATAEKGRKLKFCETARLYIFPFIVYVKGESFD